MQTMKPRIVIIGAGMAGITAANKLYTAPGFADMFELSVLEGGTRIGGRINTSEFEGDRIEMGATWIHGIIGSPIHKIAQETHALDSEQPWEYMDGCLAEPITIAEGGFELSPSLVEPISDLFKKLMDFAQGNEIEDVSVSGISNTMKLAAKSCGPGKNLSIGSFLRQGLIEYWDSMKEKNDFQLFDNWSRRAVEEAIFAMHENIQRTYTSAGDLQHLDFNAESEYILFPGEEITIAKGYLSIVESLASVLPAGLIQLNRKVTKIEWQPNGHINLENGHGFTRPVKLHFVDGTTMLADHVIITVSLGVLKQGINEDVGLFNPPLPSFKNQAISKLGYGVVNKLFVELTSSNDEERQGGFIKFPHLQMVFHQPESKFYYHPEIPWWMRRTSSLAPIYSKSKVLLSWFAGDEALELESLSDDEILDGVSSTVSNFFMSNTKCHHMGSNPPPPPQLCNGNNGNSLEFGKILRSKWGNDPLFLGSYSYVAVGSSCDDIDAMAEPLPKKSSSKSDAQPQPQPQPLQILFAGEATHRTHYSTTHGAYFSGLREANRLLQHFKV